MLIALHTIKTSHY